MKQNQPIWKEGKTGAAPPPVLQFLPLNPNLIQKIGNMSTCFRDAYQRTGPIYQFNRGGQNLMVLSGVAANQFMNQAGSQFINAETYRAEQNEELGVKKNLVSMTGDAHYEFRKLHKRGYARSALNPKYSELIQITQQRVNQWQQDERIPIVDVLIELIGEQLGVGVVNYPIEDYLDDVVTFVRTVTIETVARTRPRQMLDTAVYKQAKARSLELADKVIAAHRGCPMHQREPDVIDDLLAELDKDANFLTEQELRISALGGYIGGLDTVAYTCAFLLYNLLKHPTALAKVTSEIDQAFANGGMTPSTLKKMKNLYAATLETLRLYPVSPAIQATVFAPFEFCGYQVEAGQQIIIGVTVPHHLSELYPDPFSFNIDRYSNPDSKHRQPGAFAPFGIGEHLCLGAGMAETFIMLTTASLLNRVTLEMDPPTYDLSIDAMPTPKPANFFVRVTEKREEIHA